jgi:hypothetical protein
MSHSTPCQRTSRQWTRHPNVAAAMTLWIPDTSPTGTYAGILTITLISP